MRVFVVVSMLLSAALAQAQTQAPPAERRVVINMDDDVIEGSTLGPAGHIVPSRPATKSKSLIQLRKDFRREVLASGSRL